MSQLWSTQIITSCRSQACKSYLKRELLLSSQQTKLKILSDFLVPLLEWSHPKGSGGLSNAQVEISDKWRSSRASIGTTSSISSLTPSSGINCTFSKFVHDTKPVVQLTHLRNRCTWTSSRSGSMGTSWDLIRSSVMCCTGVRTTLSVTIGWGMSGLRTALQWRVLVEERLGTTQQRELAAQKPDVSWPASKAV